MTDFLFEALADQLSIKSNQSIDANQIVRNAVVTYLHQFGNELVSAFRA